MEIKEMYNEIRNYCYNLILDSKKEDWLIGNRITKDNILINIANDHRFEITIFRNANDIDSTNSYVHRFYCDVDWYKIGTKLLRKKYKEISNFLKNKEEYEKATKIYNLLPIKELRKKKLEEILLVYQKTQRYL